MQPPPVQFATSPDGGKIGYQVLGEGPIDLVVVSALNPNIDVLWDDPKLERFHRRLGSFARLILYNQRGTGISDAAPRGWTVEEHSMDLLAVLDAAGSKEASICGVESGGFVAMLFAASFPDRTRSLALLNCLATFRRHADYPAGFPDDALERLIEASTAAYGTGENLRTLAPELVGDERYRERYARLERTSVSPTTQALQTRTNLGSFDVRHILSTIRAPTLVISHTNHAFIRTGHGRYLAEHIAGARYMEREGFSGIFWVHDVDWVLEELQAFFTGSRGAVDLDDRVLATVLFTDIVGSTARAADMGDRRWRVLLDEHDSIVHREIERFRGRAVSSTGDGILATFDGPARAIRCAVALGEAVRPLGIELRTGLHTGEVELRGDNVGGIAVHIAARVMGEAEPGTVLVSGAVPPLVAGAGVDFEDLGVQTLKGVPGDWRLYMVKI